MAIYSRLSIQNTYCRWFWIGKSKCIIELLNLINNQPDIDKIYLYAKYPYEAKYQCLINKRKMLIVFDDMIADMINNKRLNLVVTELFICGRKLNISLINKLML